MKKAEFHEIPSETKPGRKYVLRKTKKGWACSCPAFVFRGRCKHIDKYIQNNKFVK